MTKGLFTCFKCDPQRHARSVHLTPGIDCGVVVKYHLTPSSDDDEMEHQQEEVRVIEEVVR